MDSATPPERPRRIVVLGGGFGGLSFAAGFRGEAEVVLLDRRNHHLFQPLLYQVATTALAAPDIAQPLRSIFSRNPRVDVRMHCVDEIQLTEQCIVADGHRFEYDYLLIALGGRTTYFGNDQWAEYAMGLKSLDEAQKIRNSVLAALELADSGTHDAADRRELMTTVVVGAGPTGVEMAGALAELYKRVLRRDYRRINAAESRILLVDAAPQVLPGFSAELSRKAQRQLEELGVEVRMGKMVKGIESRRVVFEEETIEAANIVWAAGLEAVPVVKALDVPKDRAGRIEVNADCSIPGYPNAFAIGDNARLKDANGTPVPWVAPAAMQMGRFVARVIEEELKGGRRLHRPAFAYRDKGAVATIGRIRAVAAIRGREFSGAPAWFAWLTVHLFFLIGLRNKLSVLLQWFFAYIRFQWGARILWGSESNTPAATDHPPGEEAVTTDPSGAPSGGSQ